MIEVKVSDFIDFKEHILDEYRNKLYNFDTFERFVNMLSLDDLEKGINDLSCRFVRYNSIFLSFNNQEEKEVLSLYDEYLKFIHWNS